MEMTTKEAVHSKFSLLLWLKVCGIVFTDIHTGVFAEGSWDKIFDTKTIAALGHALSSKTYHLRSSVVNFFTAAVAQGVLHCCDGILIPKYLQRGFGTRYFKLRPLLHLGMHSAVKPITSEAVQSISSLLL